MEIVQKLSKVVPKYSQIDPGSTPQIKKNTLQIKQCFILFVGGLGGVGKKEKTEPWNYLGIASFFSKKDARVQSWVNCPISIYLDWALGSEPGFSDFQIFDFGRILLGKSGSEISKKNN